MSEPWQELDKWAEIEVSQTGDRIKDSKKYAAIIRARDKLYARHMRVNRHCYYPDTRQHVPPIECTERFLSRVEAAFYGGGRHA